MSRVVAVVTVAVTSAGCAQIAGIEATSGKGRTADTVAIKRMSIGADVAYTDFDLTGFMASYLVENPGSAAGFDRIAADSGNDPTRGTWHADLPDPEPVELTLPEGPGPGPVTVPHLLAFDSRALVLTVSVLEHPGRTPAPGGAMLTVPAVALDRPVDPADTFETFTAGSWTVRPFTGAEQPAAAATQLGPVTYPFSSATSTSGRAELDQLTSHDAIFLLRYTGSALTGFARATPFDQTGNDTLDVSAVTPVTQDQTLDLKVDPNALSARYGAVQPAMTGLAMSWHIVAAPAAAAAVDAGPTLQSGTLALTDAGIPPVAFGNPFTGWAAMFVLATSESRTFTPAGMTAQVTLSAGLSQFVDLSPGVAPPAGSALPLDAGLPTMISLGDVQLVNDGATIALPAQPVEVSFVPSPPGGTLFDLQVIELALDATATTIQRRLVLAAESSEPKFKLPPEIFMAGHTYTLRAQTSSGGYPAIAAGDLQMRSLPMSQAFVDSAVFTVLP